MVRGQPGRRQAAALAVAGLVLLPMIVWYSGYWPMTQWLVDTDGSVVGYPPFSFPLSVVAFYNVVLDEFAYRVVFGWPDGLTLLLLPLEHADATLSRMQRQFCLTVLGAADALAFSLTALVLIGLGRRHPYEARRGKEVVVEAVSRQWVFRGAVLQSLFTMGFLLWTGLMFFQFGPLIAGTPMYAGLILPVIGLLNLFGVVGLFLAVAWFAWCTEPRRYRRRFIITGAVGLVFAGFLPGLVMLIGAARTHSEPE
jgi:hypothetical protein